MPEINIRIRQEGPWINAYFPGSTKGDGEPILIATMRTSMADMHPKLFESWKAFVSLAAVTLLEGAGATVHGIEEQQAAEHERAGHA